MPGFVAEYQSSETPSVDLVAVEDRVAKRCLELRNNLRKSENLMSDSVDVDHEGCEMIRKSTSNSALAGTNSAENAQYKRLTG